MQTVIFGNKKTVSRLDALLIGIVVIVVALWVGGSVLKGRDALVVWSCGGNYEFLKEYVREFEDRENCKVRYTAAPVQYLLDLAVSGERVPDVIVGRGGPGWVALKKKGILVSGPTFFALDPLGIAVAPGNPLKIETVNDLGRQGVRVVQAPRAMRPKGKVPALLMSSASGVYPGLVERWTNNFVVTDKCGRNMLEAVVLGEADAALAPRTLLTYPAFRDKLEFVPVSPKILLKMKKGGGSIPQCAAVLDNPKGEGRAELASRFVAGLVKSSQLLAKHGYLPLESPEAQKLKGLLKIAVPKDMPAFQVALAQRLEAYKVLPEARRRYLKVAYTFGPNHYVARSLYQSGQLSLGAGAGFAARRDWEWVVSDYPPKGPCEFDSPVMNMARNAPPVEPLPYEHWVEAAKDAIQDLPAVSSAGIDTIADPRVKELFPIMVEDGDPPKNSKREFGLGLHLLQAGDFDFATRDLLKVVTLAYPNRYLPDADYLLGICARERGFSQVAREQWKRVVRAQAESPAGQAAQKQLQQLQETVEEKPVPKLAMPDWTESYETNAERGMTYGMRLYEHGLPLFAFKEMMKVLSGVYGRHKLQAEARYRAGIAAMALGNRKAAMRQWNLCRMHYPDSPWAGSAATAIAGLLGKGAAPEVQVQKPPAAPKGSPGVRLRIAEEFRKAEVWKDDQVILEYLKVLTVARPKPGQGDKIVATAMLGLAESLIHTNRLPAAKKEYNAVVRLFPETPWAKKAKEGLRQMDEKAMATGQGEK